MKVIVFEDEAYQNLLPITYTRASFELRISSKTLLEKIVKRLNPEKTIVIAREYLRRVLEERYPWVRVSEEVSEDVLFVNGLLYLGEREYKALEKLLIEEDDKALFLGKRLVAARISEKTLRKESINIVYNHESLRKYVKTEYVDGVRLIEYPWHIVNYLPEIIREEFSNYVGKPPSIDGRVYVRGDEKFLQVGDNTVIEPGTVIDVRNGPVYIGCNVEIESHSRIAGPTYIGDKTVIYGGRVESSIIGDECRIGGEVVNSVIHGYSNKRHYGFLGHSYIGEWVNLGAGFTNSNLKNTYGEVKMNIRGQNINTGNIFLGCFIGDHARASIGTLVYTGKKIGVASHIHGTVIEDVPSFTFYAKSLGVDLIELEIDYVLKSVKRMMARRNASLKPAEEDLLRKIYEETSNERRLVKAMRRQISFNRV